MSLKRTLLFALSVTAIASGYLYFSHASAAEYQRSDVQTVIQMAPIDPKKVVELKEIPLITSVPADEIPTLKKIGSQSVDKTLKTYSLLPPKELEVGLENVKRVVLNRILFFQKNLQGLITHGQQNVPCIPPSLLAFMQAALERSCTPKDVALLICETEKIRDFYSNLQKIMGTHLFYHELITSKANEVGTLPLVNFAIALTKSLCSQFIDLILFSTIQQQQTGVLCAEDAEQIAEQCKQCKHVLSLTTSPYASNFQRVYEHAPEYSLYALTKDGYPKQMYIPLVGTRDQ